MSLPPPAYAKALMGAFPEFVETHISWVFLDRSDVYKVKKPVRFPFLDFSSDELRLRACEAEVELNRRLAPDVYLGVVPVTMDAVGRVSFGGQGLTVDHAVHMRRLPDDERADVMLRKGALRMEHIEALAERLVMFHRAAEVAYEMDGPGSTATLRAHIEENLDSLDSTLVNVLGQEGAERVCRAQREGLVALTSTLEARRARGLVRDGHGDLRLDHVYVDGEGAIRVLDCVEFDRAFRVADVCADVAFFAMSLRERGETGLSEGFIARYARDASDHEIYTLIDFYMTYWALVRAKVSEARAEQLEGEVQRAQREISARLLRLAHELLCPPRKRAVLFAVGGVIGSGKSRLASRIAAELSAPVLQSDRLRKQLQGVSPETKLEGEKAYAKETTARLYEELRKRASYVLASGRPVIVDASFRERRERDLLSELARQHGVPFMFFECHAPREVLAQRLLAREEKHGISDARIDLLDSFLANYEPLSQAELEHAQRVDTSGDKETTYAAVAPCVNALAAP